MESVSIKDKNFILKYSSEYIENCVSEIANRINQDYKDSNPVFIPILNGAFMFASDLVKKINIPCEICFIKLSSYCGLKSSGKVKEVLGLNIDIKDRDVIIVEDIIDSGKTMFDLKNSSVFRSAGSLKIASFILKPEALEYPVMPDYYAIENDKDFLIGYGLDYDGYGRNYNSIYTIEV